LRRRWSYTRELEGCGGRNGEEKVRELFEREKSTKSAELDMKDGGRGGEREVRESEGGAGGRKKEREERQRRRVEMAPEAGGRMRAADRWL